MSTTPSLIPTHPDQNPKPQAVASADKHIRGIFILLCIISIIELYSASSREVAGSSLGVMGPIVRHLIMLAGGVGIVVYCSKRHYTDFIPFTIVFGIASAVLMIYVMVAGDVINGARRSVRILGIGIYPAEMVKLSAVLVTALVMSLSQDTKRVGITRNGMIACVLIILFYSVLLVKQGLTNTLLLLTISVSMMIIGGVKWKHILAFAGLLLFCGGCLFFYLFATEFHCKWPSEAEIESWQNEKESERSVSDDESGSRLKTWILRFHRFGNERPKWEIEPTGKNRQEILSYMAQAHGGIHGVGPGNSREASRLPLAFSDYIYAIVIEELGLIGGVVVILLYLWLLGRAASITSRCTMMYPAIVVAGLASMIACQALFHIAIVSGVFPVSGQPLPLISKGGTSIFVTCIAFGIMLSISRTATQSGNKKQQINEETQSLPEQLRNENRMQL